MNITLAIDETIAENAREAARKIGKTLNQVVREHLEQLAGSNQVEHEITAFELRCAASKGRLNGWIFDRDEANERR